MSRGFLLRSALLSMALVAMSGLSAKAQDWSDYLHWPYVPPQAQGSGFEYKGLYDGYFAYPREQRIVPQIQGPYYRNYYGGVRKGGHHTYAESLHPWNKRRYYHGYHYFLDVF